MASVFRPDFGDEFSEISYPAALGVETVAQPRDTNLTPILPLKMSEWEYDEAAVASAIADIKNKVLS